MRNIACFLGALWALGSVPFTMGCGPDAPPDGGDSDTGMPPDDADAGTMPGEDGGGGAMSVTVAAAGDMLGADILVNAASTGLVTVATLDAEVGDTIDVTLPEFISIPQTATVPGDLVVPFGRDISLGWHCDRAPEFRTVRMEIRSDPDRVMATGLFGSVLEVRGNSLSGEGGAITGTIVPDGSSLEFSYGSITEHCTR